MSRWLAVRMAAIVGAVILFTFGIGVWLFTRATVDETASGPPLIRVMPWSGPIPGTKADLDVVLSSATFPMAPPWNFLSLRLGNGVVKLRYGSGRRRDPRIWRLSIRRRKQTQGRRGERCQILIPTCAGRSRKYSG